MQTGTICFPLRDTSVLLGMKKRGFGKEKWNGFGGKLEDGETPRQAAVREIFEESCLCVLPDSLEEMAVIEFLENGVPIFKNTIFVFREWTGVEKETEEMRPKWFLQDAVPYDQMFAADKAWIPLVLTGKKFDGIVRFKSGLNEFERFEYTQRT